MRGKGVLSSGDAAFLQGLSLHFSFPVAVRIPGTEWNAPLAGPAEAGRLTWRVMTKAAFFFLLGNKGARIQAF